MTMDDATARTASEDSPVDRDVLIASAVLDGVASDSELRVARDDDAVAALVERLGSARDLVAEPVVPPPTDVIDGQIAVVLAQVAGGGSSLGSPSGTPTGDQVRQITSARSRRVTPARILAAAAVLAVAVMVPVVAGLNRHESSRSDVAMVNSTADADTRENAASADAGVPFATTTTYGMQSRSTPPAAESAPETGLGSAVSTGGSAVVDGDLGPVESPEQLKRMLAVMIDTRDDPNNTGSADGSSADPSAGSGSEPDSGGGVKVNPMWAMTNPEEVARCQSFATTEVSGDAVLIARMSLTWRSRSAAAYIFAVGSQIQVIVASSQDQGTCAVLLDITM